MKIAKKKKHMENGVHDLYIYIKVVWHLLSFNCSCNKRVKSTSPSHHLMFCLFSFGMGHGHLAPRIIQGSVSNLCQVLRWSFTSHSAKPEYNTFTTMCTLWRQQHLTLFPFKGYYHVQQMNSFRKDNDSNILWLK